jgi:prepilin-type N-terminal cleavage/methylation domain-containing protein
MRSSTTSRRGFTIVELLVVIVVIAILAAVAVVSYTGVSSRATEATVRADLNVLAKQVEAYKVTEGQYPPILNNSASNPMPEMETVLRRSGLYAATRYNTTNDTTAKSYVFCSPPDGSVLYIVSVAPIIKATSMGGIAEALGKKLIFYASNTQTIQEATMQSDPALTSLQMNVCKSVVTSFDGQTWNRRWSFDVPDTKAQ